MLDSLAIKNYRILKDLRIPSLSRVNLITGENNTGKSTLLEAVSLYASRCDLNLIVFLLKERGEYNVPHENSLNSANATVKTFSSLFLNRKISFSVKDAISIGVIQDKSLYEQSSFAGIVTLRFVKYVFEVINGAINQRKKIIVNEEDFDAILDSYDGLEMKYGGVSYVLRLDDSVRSAGVRSISQPDNFEFIRVQDIDREINRRLWNLITLTEKEDFVIQALKIIEPGIERLTFIENEWRERVAVVKLNGDNIVRPIRSMGDGINRILTIILALVNSDNGYLLIDEFENGLHYSVQEKLWEIILKLSESLNVQVFATTHSEDCIRGFAHVLNSGQNIDKGKLLRLDNIKGTIKQTEFSADELKIATESDIEIR